MSERPTAPIRAFVDLQANVIQANAYVGKMTPGVGATARAGTAGLHGGSTRVHSVSRSYSAFVKVRKNSRSSVDGEETTVNLEGKSKGDQLVLLAGLGDSASVDELLRDRSVDIDHAGVDVDRPGTTALIQATRYGRVDTIRLLLGHGASVYAEDKSHRNVWYETSLPVTWPRLCDCACVCRCFVLHIYNPAACVRGTGTTCVSRSPFKGSAPPRRLPLRSLSMVCMLMPPHFTWPRIHLNHRGFWGVSWTRWGKHVGGLCGVLIARPMCRLVVGDDGVHGVSGIRAQIQC